jgi:hypothetical protein
MASIDLSISELMALAVRRRDELNVFIALLTNIVQGRDVFSSLQGQSKGQDLGQQHSV